MTELTPPRSRTAQPRRFLHGCLWGFVCTQACWQPPAQPGGARGRGGQPCGFVPGSRSLPLPSLFFPCSSFVTSPLCAAAPALVTEPLCRRGSPSPPPASGGAGAGCGHRAAQGLSWHLGLSRSRDPPPHSHSCLPRRRTEADAQALPSAGGEGERGVGLGGDAGLCKPAGAWACLRPRLGAGTLVPRQVSRPAGRAAAGGAAPGTRLAARAG